MTVAVAVADNREGQQALVEAVQEARALQTDLVVVNLTLSALDVSSVPADLRFELVDRAGSGDVDPVDTVLNVLEARPEVTRLVVGVRHRSPLGKAVLGSVTQRLLLEAPVPVLAVKAAVPG